MKAAETVVIAEIAPRAATNAAPGKNAALAASSVRVTARGHVKASEVRPAMDDVTSDTATTAVARALMAVARARVTPARPTAVTRPTNPASA